MNIPRIAVGTIQPGADATAVIWGLLTNLEQSGHKVQSFRYQANFVPCDGIRAITGLGERHLDSWLMPRELCAALFEFGARGSDLALVEGCYDVTRQRSELQGGSLDTLCEWLDLPRVIVLDATLVKLCTPLPTPPAGDAIVLDRVENAAHAAELATTLETLWRIPVIGYLPESKEIRRQIARLPRATAPSTELCRALGRELGQHLQLGRLLRLASRPHNGEPLASACLTPNAIGERLRIAVAFDEAFQGYFPDTLDVLEACGAELRAFSPLRSPELPPGTDVVYLGCGCIDRHAEALSANLCLRQSIQSFAAAGGRVYAEGAGLAYLCRQVILQDGSRLPMVNALPAVALRSPSPEPVRPATVRLKRATWLGSAYQELRGYLNTSWRIMPWGSLTSLALEAERQDDLFGLRNVVGSRMHFHFAAQPEFLRAFFRPHHVTYAAV